MPFRVLVSLFVLTGMAASLGCGSPGRIDISGQVKLKGAPLEQGTIEFHPVSGGTLEGSSIRAGRYALSREGGLLPGRYRVIISSADEKSRVASPDTPPGSAPPASDRAPPDWNVNSNTLMIAEVLQGRGSDLRGFSWWGDASGFSAYLGPNSSLPDRIYTAGYCNNQPQFGLPCDVSTTAAPTMFAARSRHSGGVMAALCDGSAKFFTKTVSIDTWRALGSSQGGEVIPGTF